MAGYRFSIISKNDNRGPVMQPDLDAAADRGTDRTLTQPLGGAVKFILVLAVVLLRWRTCGPERPPARAR
jgi:hypothetical protein